MADPPSTDRAPARPSPRDAAPGGLRFAVRKLLRGVNRASLATALPEGGQPYVSLVTVATDSAGRPLLLLSRLAEHSRALAADPRVALLFDGTAGYANPQQGPRVSVLGRVMASDDPAVRRRFLARHPGAALYADFADFTFYRVEPERFHWVGGFGKAVWLDQGLVCEAALAAAFEAAEPDLLEAINAAEGPLLSRLARSLGQQGEDWRLVAADPDGCDLARRPPAAAGEDPSAAQETAVVRLAFDAPLLSPGELRLRLQELAKRAGIDPLR